VGYFLFDLLENVRGEGVGRFVTVIGGGARSESVEKVVEVHVVCKTVCGVPGGFRFEFVG
jgi:hypothetical protein